MKYILPLVIASIMALPATLTYAQSAPEEVKGYWYTKDNASIVEVFKTGGKYAGKIIWLKEPRYEKGDKNAGKLKIDLNNPEKKKRSNPIVGLSMLGGFTFNSGDKKWTGGTIYDPEKGKTYKCEIKFEKDSGAWDGKKLYVRGYLGIPTFGRTTYWYRVPETDLKKYDLVKSEDQ